MNSACSGATQCLPTSSHAPIVSVDRCHPRCCRLFVCWRGWWQVAPGDETVMRGKSQGGGCCIKKTNTALVIGTYESPVQPGDVNVVVENLGDYLLQSQY